MDHRVLNKAENSRQLPLLYRTNKSRNSNAYGQKVIASMKRATSLFADKFIQDAQEGKLKEKMERERRREIATENQGLLKHQMDYIKYKEEVEKQEAYLADKQMQYMERQHQQRLAEQAGTVRAAFPLMKNKWYS